MSVPSPLCELFVPSQANRYPDITEAIFDMLDNASFLASRAVCHSIKEAADHYKRRWKEVLEMASPTAIIDASRAGNRHFVQLMINNGADVNVQMAVNKETALHKASRAGHSDIVDLLLAKGANIGNVSVPSGETALHMACLMGHLSVVEILLAHGAEVNDFHWRPDEAVLYTYPLPNLQNKKRKTHMKPLHLACMRGNLKIVKLLVDHGADVNCNAICFTLYKTPLDFALHNNHHDVVEFLLANGFEKK